MSRSFVDIEIFSSRNMERDGNIDNQYWFDKTIEQKLAASITMIEVAFNTTNFIRQKVDKQSISIRKRNSL